MARENERFMVAAILLWQAARLTLLYGVIVVDDRDEELPTDL